MMKLFRYLFGLILLLCVIILVTHAATATKSRLDSGSYYTDPTTGMEFVLVKGGCYQMGNTFEDGYINEKPVHEVCVDDYYIGKFAVTQGQWKAVMGDNPSFYSSCGDNCPVESVSWDDAQDYIDKLSAQTGKKYHLPTEAEWEYAARSGGKKEKWAGTSDFKKIDDYAWLQDNSEKKTHPVGMKKPNGLGLYDMIGNVCEWANDGYDHDYYKKSPKMNPEGAYIDDVRVFRGGSWRTKPRRARATNRCAASTSIRCSGLGFRLAMTL